MTAKRILVVEDEEAIRHALCHNLAREGYAVSEARTGVEALAEARRSRPDLILLDLMLPELGGLEVCRILRQEMTVPILVLTAKATEVDKVTGLHIGADDYMTKPFSLQELMARVTALLRRVELDSRPAAPERAEVDRLGPFVLNRSARTVHVDAEEVRLAPKEFDLLSYLVGNPGRVHSREQLIQQIWGRNFYGSRKTVDVHVRWLREKFERFDVIPFRITTVFGVGYRLDTAAAAADPSPQPGRAATEGVT